MTFFLRLEKMYIKFSIIRIRQTAAIERSSNIIKAPLGIFLSTTYKE